MKTPPIDTEEEYERALARMVELMDAPEGTPEAQERESLLQAIEAYEEDMYPLDPL